MADLFEVLLVDGGQRWHAGWLVDDEARTDVLLREGGRVLLFGSRAALAEHGRQRGTALQDDLPDEIDLDLGGWLGRGQPVPSTDEVAELWHLLVDDPVAGPALAGEAAREVYGDLVRETPDWLAVHGDAARAVLADAVQRLRGAWCAA